MVRNWKPGIDLYIDVSVIDPTGQNWRSNLVAGGVGEAASIKESQKREYYANHFNLLDKRNEFSPFILEAQGGVGETALRVITEMLKKKKERSIRSTTLHVKQNEVTRGEVLKKIVFECQRQMARTLIDKTSREEHVLSKRAESRDNRATDGKSN